MSGRGNHRLHSKLSRIFAFAPAWLALVYLLAVTFPGIYRALNPAMLDEGWTYALNYLVSSKYVFGRDVVFTYGPLGYLIEPRNIGSNLFNSAAFMAAIHLVWAAVLITYLRATTQKTQFVLFALAYAVICAFGVSFDYQIVTIILMLCYLPIKLNQPKSLPGTVAGVLAALLTLIKFNIGVVALVTVALATLCWRLEFGGRATRSILATYASFALSFGVLSGIYLKSFKNLCTWLGDSMQIANGYSECMSLVDKGTTPALGFALLCIFAFATIVLLWKKAWTGHLALIAFVSVAASFKHSFVRQDSHEAAFFLCLMSVISIIGVACRDQKQAYACFWSLAIVSIFSLQSLAQSERSLTGLADVLNTSRGQQNIKNLFDMKSASEKLNQETRQNSHLYKLPEDLLTRIEKAGNPTVGTLPNCVGFCPANGLRWNPLPVLQLYKAYTPALDRLCADHFDAQDAPRMIICGSTTDLKFDFGEIDHRNPMLESPLTALSLLRNYKPVRFYQKADVLLLQRRISKRQISLTDESSKKCHIDEWIAVPASQSPVLGYIDLQAKPIPQLFAKLYQLPPLELECISKDGARTWRMAPSNLNSGLLLNCFPRSFGELAQFMNGDISNQVKAIRLTGPGSRFFKRTFGIKWVKVGLSS